MIRLATLLAFAATGTLAAEPSTISPAAVDRLIEDALKRWQAPGLAVAVVSGDRTVVLKGYGTKRTGADEPVSPDTLFPLASCTKAFTTALLAKLADDRKLDWDDPVRKHLPTFRLSDPNADALLTLRDLVSHRTGVPGHDLLWYRATWDINEVLRRAKYLPLTGPFRGSYQYNSIPFMAAGRLMEARTGKRWEELIREELCTPLGMTGATFTADEAANVKDRALGHRRGKDGRPEAMPAYEPAEPNPAGSMSATARDLAAWVKFHLAGGRVNGKPVITSANLAETVTPQIVMPRTAEVRAIYPESKLVSYAMGWVVYDHRGELVVAHGGVIDGFRAQITFLPERNFGFALLNNLHETKMNIAIGNAIIDLALGLPAKDWNAHYLKVEADERTAKQAEIDARNKARKPGTKPSASLEKYVGEYGDAAYGSGQLKLDDSRLVWEWSSFRCPLEHFQDETFRVAEGFFAEKLVEFVVTNGTVSEVRAMGVEFKRK